MDNEALGFFESMALSVLFNVLKVVVKNPQKKVALQKALLKLRDAINSAYPESLAENSTVAFGAPLPLTSSHFVNATETQAAADQEQGEVLEMPPPATGHANGW